MPHDTPLITTIVAALVLAFIFGAIANRLKMPPIVGYLIAGVCVGPHSPGFVADQTLAPQLAEIGVILLMFGVGLHFSLKDLLSVRAVAIPGALIRMLFATAMGMGLATLMGWPLIGGLVFGLGLAVSSTVVTLKVLQDRHLVDSDRGRIAMGWLVVEDLAMVLALVLIPAFAGAGVAGGLADAAHPAAVDPFVTLTEQVLHIHLPLWGVLGITVVKLLAFVGFMVVVGRRIIPYILHATAHTGSRELFRLAVLAIALGVAAGAASLFGVSLALGAFFAGMILSESELSHRAAQETLPLRDAFGVLFFVSVGMLFDPSILVREPLPVLATLVIIMFGKSIIGFLLLLLFRRPVAAALTISASLAQIGEFSFILAALGIGLGLMPEEGRGLILAGSIISIILNAPMFWLSEQLRPRLEARTPSHRTEPELGPVVPDHADQIAAMPQREPGEVLEEMAEPTRLSNHVILIGYGRVGTVVAGELWREGAPFLVIEDAEGRVLAAREAGMEVIVGNAATRNTLMLANVMGAQCVVIAIPNAFEAGQATEQCRKFNSAVKIIARAHSDEEVEYLDRLGADEVIMGEREIGLGMIDWLKGETRGEAHAAARRDAGMARLVPGENLLQQARQGQPLAEADVADQLVPFELFMPADEPPPEAVVPPEAVIPPQPSAPAAEEEPPVLEEPITAFATLSPAAVLPPMPQPIAPFVRNEPTLLAVAAAAPALVPPPPVEPEVPSAVEQPTSQPIAATPAVGELVQVEPVTPIVAEPERMEPVGPISDMAMVVPIAVPELVASAGEPKMDVVAVQPTQQPEPSAPAVDSMPVAPPIEPEPIAMVTRFEAVDAVSPLRPEPVDMAAGFETVEAPPPVQLEPVVIAPGFTTVEITQPVEPQPIALAEPEPAALAETEPPPELAAQSEPEPQPELAARLEPERASQPEPQLEPTTAYQQEPTALAEPQPQATAEYPPEPTALAEPQPEPVAPSQLEPQPELAAQPEPQAQAPAEYEPELAPLAAFQPEPPPDRVASIQPEAAVGEFDIYAVAIEPSALAEPEPQPQAEAAPPRPSPGFRVVPASEIIILPPENAETDPDPEPLPAATFRSEFWEEERRPASNGLELVDGEPEPGPMRNVQDPEPERPPVDDAAWLAAIERDLFGGRVTASEPGPNEVPPPVPQPVETPKPQEEPPPTPEPVETPQPAEEPQPPSPPMQTPPPQEIPATAPQPPMPSGPATRAEAEHGAVHDEVDRDTVA